MTEDDLRTLDAYGREAAAETLRRLSKADDVDLTVRSFGVPVDPDASTVDDGFMRRLSRGEHLNADFLRHASA